MPSPLNALADAVDDLSARCRATISETPNALTIAALSADDAQGLTPLLQALTWGFQVVDDAGEVADSNSLTAPYAPFVITVQKPTLAGALAVVTLEGLRGFLAEERLDEVWQVATLSTAFATMATSIQRWGQADIFSPAVATKSPQELVREHTRSC